MTFLASLPDTMTAAVCGAAFTSYASQGSNQKDPVHNIVRGASWGAAFPSILNVVHTVASKVLGFAFGQLKSGYNFAAKLNQRAVAYASANPYVAGVGAVALAVILGAVCLSGQKNTAAVQN